MKHSRFRWLLLFLGLCLLIGGVYTLFCERPVSDPTAYPSRAPVLSERAIATDSGSTSSRKAISSESDQSGFMIRVESATGSGPLSKASIVHFVPGNRPALHLANVDQHGKALIPIASTSIDRSRLEVNCKGYLSENFPVTQSLHNEHTPFVVRLTPARTTRVRIVRDTGEPVKDALIQISPSCFNELPPPGWPKFTRSDPRFERRLSPTDRLSFEPRMPSIETTNAAGEILIDEFPCGVDVWILATGSFLMHKSVHNVPEVVGTEIPTITIRVELGSEVHGKIVNESLNPLPNSPIRMNLLSGREESHSLRSVFSDANGIYKFENVPSGLARFNAFAAGSPSVEVAINSSVVEAPVLVIPTQHMVQLLLRSKYFLPKRWTFVVFDPEKPGLRVGGSSEIHERGLLVSEKLTAGRWIATVFASLGTPSIHVARIHTLPINIPCGMIEFDVDSVLGAVDADLSGLVPADVKAVNLTLQQSILSVETELDPKFPASEQWSGRGVLSVENVPISKGHITLGGLPSGSYVMNLPRPGGSLLTSGEFHVIAGTCSNVSVTKQRVPAIRCRVLNGTQPDATGDTVELKTGDLPSRTVPTDAQGVALFREVFPGKYVLTARTSNHRVGTTTVVVTPGKDTDAEVQVAAGATIRVRVPKRVKEAEYFVVCCFRVGVSGESTVQPDADGWVVFQGLEPGIYNVIARFYSNGHRAGGRLSHVTVSAGETVVLEMDAEYPRRLVAMKRDGAILQDIKAISARWTEGNVSKSVSTVMSDSGWFSLNIPSGNVVFDAVRHISELPVYSEMIYSIQTVSGGDEAIVIEPVRGTLTIKPGAELVRVRRRTP